MPPVVATMVVHQPGEWFAETLQGLIDQDYPGLQLLFLLTGEATDPGNQPARDLIDTMVPDAVIRHVGGNPGYAASCNSVLSLVQGDGGIFCFLHDDVVLAPGAVSALVEEMYRSNAGVVGPKLVHWQDVRRIQSVGIAVDRLGVEMPLADDGEVDQEQHDIVQDVFELSSACLMVRADLFRSVEGFNPQLATVGADLDFCWRIHLTGARVVIVPSAVARHRESMLERNEDDEADLQMQRDLVRLATVFTLTSRARLFVTSVEAIVVTLVHAVVVMVTGAPRRGLDELRALLTVPFSVGAIRRRRATVRREVTDSEIHALQVRGSAWMVGYLRRRDRRRGIEQAQAGLTGTKEAAPRSSIILWSVLIAVLVVGSRDLILNGPATVGQFVPFVDGPRALLSSFTSGWWNSGFGQVGPVPTHIALTAIGGVATFGHMALLRTLFIVGAPLIGWLGVWRFASVLTTRAARVAATLAYAAVPLAYTSIAAGRWGALATYALFPWVVHHSRRLVGHMPLLRGGQDTADEFGDLDQREWRRAFAIVTLLGAVLVAIEPGALLALALLGAAWTVVTLLHGAPAQYSFRWVGVIALTVLSSVAMNLPWAGTFVRSGWWEAVTGAPIEGGRQLGLRRLLRFEMGEYVLARPALLLVAPVVGAILVVRGSRLPWALRGAALSIIGFLLVFLDDKALLPVHLPEPAVMLVPVAFGIAVCAGSMGAGLAVDLRGGRISWRQPLGVVVAGAFAIGLVPGAVNAVAGTWHQPGTTLPELLTQLPDQSESGDYRTLFVGDARVLPGSPTNLGYGIAFAVANGRGASLDDLSEAAPTRTGDAGSRAVRGIVRGTTARAGRLLAPLGVRFIVVPIIDGGLSTRSHPVAEPRGLVDAMSRQLDFKRRYSSPDLAIFENSAWVPVASLLTTSGAEASKSAGAESMIANDLTGATPVLPSVGALRESSVRAETGTLHLSVPYTTHWKVTVDGAEVPVRPAFGLTNAYDIATPGMVSVSFEPSMIGRTVALLMVVVWLAVGWVALPRRRRPPRRSAAVSVSTSVDGDAISFDGGER